MTIQNEGSKIGDPEKPGGFSHPEINDAFKPLAPADHGWKASEQYGQIADQWESGVRVFAARIRRSSAAAWEGTAAEQARQAIGNYATRAEDLVPVLHALSVQVENAVVSIMRTQNDLPPVIEKKAGWRMSEWDFLWFDNERTDTEEVARQVMQDNYVNGFTEVDRQIPVLPVPVNPTRPLHTDLPTGNGDQPGPGGTTAGQGGDPSGTDTGQPEVEDPTVEEPGAEESDEPGSEQPAGTEQPGETVPAGTTPSTTESPVSTTPSTTTVPSGTTTGPGGPGSPGGSPVTTGDPGRTVQGTPSTPGGTVSAGAPATGTNAAAARGGMPGMMSPGGAGRGQGGQGEDRHQTPDYLINAENAEELLGEQAPTIPGGVLGGETPAAQPPRND